MRKRFERPLHTALIVTGLTLGGTAMAQPQGLYSVEGLLEAPVFTQQEGKEDIGEVEDVLLDESMQLRALVIETDDDNFKFGENEYIIESGNFSVETTDGNDLEQVEYRVFVNLTPAQISQQPQYTNDWWMQTKQTALSAWENTKQTARSAWENTKEATSEALEDASNALDEAGEEADQAVDINQ
ncbi:MAG: PRC-barrel domain containing protein [Halomonas sp.]|nr:PRC-barrel domain containing protein [Halomonas sp.]